MKRIIYNLPKSTNKSVVQHEYTPINFVFEKHYENLISCTDINSSGLPRVHQSPLASSILHFKNIDKSCIDYQLDKFIELTKIKEQKYIIATSVAHSPFEWCGEDFKDISTSDQYTNRKNLFTYLNPRYIQDLQKGIAFLLIDQTHEGYHPDYLFEWFHNSCEHFNIEPKQIIYVTGNMIVKEQYDLWLTDKMYSSKMLTFGHPIFEPFISMAVYQRIVPVKTVEQKIIEREKNFHNIKLFDILQKRPRGHRIWFFNELVKHDLLQDSIATMNKIENVGTLHYDTKTLDVTIIQNLNKLLPLIPESDESYEKELNQFSDGDCGKYLNELNDHIFEKTWFSVVSEASFAEDTCFLSEKTFKPLATGHPFIIYGNKFSLEKLKDLGYKTFHPFLDETYDKLDTWERLDSVINSIKKIKSLSPKERLNWYKNMKDILLHNQETHVKNSRNQNPDYKSIILEYVRRT